MAGVMLRNKPFHLDFYLNQIPEVVSHIVDMKNKVEYLQGDDTLILNHERTAREVEAVLPSNRGDPRIHVVLTRRGTVRGETDIGVRLKNGSNCFTRPVVRAALPEFAAWKSVVDRDFCHLSDPLRHRSPSKRICAT
ncbi:MAG: hypothetical protein AAYR33_06215 [Acetobacteraceae bacterium]